MTTSEWIAVTLRLIEALDELEVPYAVGGSTASIIHGMVRTTLDSDIVADLKPEHVEPLTAALADEFYVEPESIRSAIASGSSFNVVHQRTMFKAVKDNDSVSVARILEEVGSCGWRSLTRKAGAMAEKDGFGLSAHTELQAEPHVITIEKTNFLRNGLNSRMYPWVNRIATDTDLRCEQKR